MKIFKNFLLFCGTSASVFNTPLCNGFSDTKRKMPSRCSATKTYTCEVVGNALVVSGLNLNLTDGYSNDDYYTLAAPNTDLDGDSEEPAESCKIQQIEGSGAEQIEDNPSTTALITSITLVEDVFDTNAIPACGVVIEMNKGSSLVTATLGRNAVYSSLPVSGGPIIQKHGDNFQIVCEIGPDGKPKDSGNGTNPTEMTEATETPDATVVPDKPTDKPEPTKVPEPTVELPEPTEFSATTAEGTSRPRPPATEEPTTASTTTTTSSASKSIFNLFTLLVLPILHNNFL